MQAGRTRLTSLFLQKLLKTLFAEAAPGRSFLPHHIMACPALMLAYSYQINALEDYTRRPWVKQNGSAAFLSSMIMFMILCQCLIAEPAQDGSGISLPAYK